MLNYRKVIVFLLLISMFIVKVPKLVASADWTPPTAVGSNVVLLINSDTNTILYSKNADEKVYPASITKLMTAILTVEKYKDNLDTIVTVQSSDITPLLNTGSSMMGLKANEQITIKQLLYGLMLSSGNDVSLVLARVVGGDVNTFVGMMNQEAIKLGCTSTNYVNPHGLQDDNQYTTAKDVYLISKYAMSLPILPDIVATGTYTVQTNLAKHTLINTNALVKTGNT
jgi:D-alanyl-D-alanine carboxypeptidase (penicillin-binding protein 5/6)